MSLVLKKATISDSIILANLNKMLIDDGGSVNSMSEAELEERMKQFLESDYLAYLFTVENATVGYALLNIGQKPFFIRQFYIKKEYRRKRYGTQAFKSIVEALDAREVDLTVLVQKEVG